MFVQLFGTAVLPFFGSANSLAPLVAAAAAAAAQGIQHKNPAQGVIISNIVAC